MRRSVWIVAKGDGKSEGVERMGKKGGSRRLGYGEDVLLLGSRKVRE